MTVTGSDVIRADRRRRSVFAPIASPKVRRPAPGSRRVTRASRVAVSPARRARTRVTVMVAVAWQRFEQPTVNVTRPRPRERATVAVGRANTRTRATALAGTACGVAPPAAADAGAPPVGGGSNLSTGRGSVDPVVAALKPMPRRANTVQIAPTWTPPKAATSAWRIALRSSRNDGCGGESRIPPVMTASAVREPRASRRSHSVWAQISPLAWTSPAALMRPRSPNV